VKSSLVSVPLPLHLELILGQGLPAPSQHREEEEKVSRDKVGRLKGIGKQQRALFARNPSAFWAVWTTPQATGQAILVKSLQELPQSTNNVVCFHCGAAGHMVSVHHLLVFEEGKDHLLCSACSDLAISEA
jgi:hypothetical protein